MKIMSMSANYNLKSVYESLVREATKEIVTYSEFVETVQRVEETLEEYSDAGRNNDGDSCGNNFNETYIATNLARWANAKAHKLKNIKAHKDYDPSEPWKIIKREAEFKREIDRYAIYDYAETLPIPYDANECVREIMRYIRRFIKAARETNLCETTVSDFTTEINGYVDYYLERANFYKSLGEEYNASSSAYQSGADFASEIIKKCTPHIGQKTNKFVRKLVTLVFGAVDEREYAKYSDALNPTVFKRTVVMSVDPVDFLMMSNGNSWSSCFWINEYRPGTYSGCYSGGTWSYMNDVPTMLMYVLESDVTENFALQGKVFRECIMFDDTSRMMCSRIYPHDYDGADTETNKEFRKYAQQFVSELYGLTNYWKSKVFATDENPFFFKSNNFIGYYDPEYFYTAACYNIADNGNEEEWGNSPRDYAHFVGGLVTCPICGDTNYDDRYICQSCDDKRQGRNTCEYCGQRYDADELVYCEDVEQYRCTDCATYCDYHERWEANENHEFYILEGNWTNDTYCDDAIEEAEADGDVWQCDNCGEYFLTRHTEKYTDPDDEDTTWCESCYERHTRECCECGAIHNRANMRRLENGDYICEDCDNDNAESDEDSDNAI